MNKVTVSPTWAESWHYANLTGQTMWTILGILLIIAAAGILIKLGGKSVGYIIGAFIVLAFGLGSILAKPIVIHISNDKQVEQQYLDAVGHEYIIDSCYKNNLLVNAAVK
jgi:predicted membrane channel-forming protein YqfA (hemolysin III family)